MTAEKPRRLGPEVMFDTEPIQGRLFDQQNDRGLDRPFSGWLGLMSAIDAARGGHPPSQQKGEA